MNLLLVATVASAAWGSLNLLTVVGTRWDRAELGRTTYLLAALVAAWAGLGVVGLGPGWPSLWAGVGALSQLSATLAYFRLCLRSRP
jgi:hypothetical protein